MAGPYTNVGVIQANIPTQPHASITKSDGRAIPWVFGVNADKPDDSVTVNISIA